MYDIDSPIERRSPPPGNGRGPVWFYASVIALVTAIVILGGVALLLALRDDGTAATTSSTSATTTGLSTTGSPSTETSLSSTTGSTVPSTTSTSLTTSTAETTTTTAPSTSTTPTTSPAPATAVWPWADSGVRYTDPVEAAIGFATDYVGYENPLAGEFMQGDSRSGEVEIRAQEDGPPTVVLVRQLTADDTWWILGSVNESVVIDEPAALATIGSPVVVSGRGRAVEGVAEVQLRSDGRVAPLGRVDVVLGANDTLLPFETSISWPGASADGGAILVIARTADGDVWEASVLRVMLDTS